LILINMKILQKGQLLIELLLAVGLSAIIIPTLLIGLSSSRGGQAQDENRQHALEILKQSNEALRNVRESGWTNFALNGTYHLVITNNSAWALAPGATTSGDFTQSIIISDVFRDTTGAISSSGAGTLDPSTKKVVNTVSWSSPRPSSVESILFIARTDNVSYLETTDVDFEDGDKGGTSVVKSYGNGEIILGSGGQGHWCSPNISQTTLDLPKNGVANAISAIEGKIFAGTGQNASGVSYAHVLVSNTNPPTASVSGTFDGYKTNDIFGEADYAYLATDNNAEEVVIVDIRTQPFAKIGYFNAPGNADATGVYVVGNIGYVTTGNRLYTFDLSSRSGSRPILDPDGVHLTADSRKVMVVGNYAYVATGESSTKFVLVDATNPANLSVVGKTIITVPDSSDIYVKDDGSRAYIVTDSSATWEPNEFFIIDTSNKSLTTFPIIGTYNTGFLNARGVTTVPGNYAIVVGHEYGSNEVNEYQVLDLSNEANPQLCGGVNIESRVNGVTSVLELDGDAYSYIITGDATSELKIIEGGPGGRYATSGVYISSTFDATDQTAFNRVQVTINRPFASNIEFQFAVAPAVNNSCAQAALSFVGPNGTTGSRYQTSVTTGNQTFHYSLPTNSNIGQCFAYKVFMSTTDTASTPVLYDIAVNYSP